MQIVVTVGLTRPSPSQTVVRFLLSAGPERGKARMYIAVGVLLVLVRPAASFAPSSIWPISRSRAGVLRSSRMSAGGEGVSRHTSRSSPCMMAGKPPSKSGGGGRGRPGPARRVAIIGGGIGGLACAKELQSLGMEPLVYDTGRLVVGGRCSSRTFPDPTGDKNAPVVFDHSAQFLSKAAHEGGDGARRWEEWVEAMKAEGVLREWENVGVVYKGGQFTARTQTSGADAALVGTGGMRSIPLWLAQGIQTDRPKWVSKARLNADASWRLWHYQDMLGEFEYVVIAHNGKCAARLMKSPGEAVAPVQRLLEVKFGSRLRSEPPQLMQLCSLWVLMAVFEEPLVPAPRLEGAFVEGVPELSWVSNNAAKLRQKGFDGGRGAWTIVSSPQFAERHKVPQENVPPEKAHEVTNLLLSAFERALGLPQGPNADQPLLRPSFTSVQLWGAANPISVADVPKDSPFIFQASTGVGVCGDWLISPSIPAAAESGIQLARHIHKHHLAKKRASRAGSRDGVSGSEGGGEQDVTATAILQTDVNLDCAFKAVAGRGAKPIGAFEASSVPATVSHHTGGRRTGAKPRTQPAPK